MVETDHFLEALESETFAGQHTHDLGASVGFVFLERL